MCIEFSIKCFTKEFKLPYIYVQSFEGRKVTNPILLSRMLKPGYFNT